MLIYKTTNLINGKIYVGKDCHSNPNYLGSGKLIKYAIKKYGRKNFRKEVIEECDGGNWVEREKYWIAKLDSRNPNIGYNIHEGGEGFEDGSKNPMFGKSQPPEVRLKMSQNHANFKGENHPNFGKPISEEQKLKQFLVMVGRKHTEEHNKKIGLSGIGRIPWNKGKTLSEEHRNKIGVASKGRIAWNRGVPAWNRGLSPSEESRKRMSESKKGEKSNWFGKKHSEKTKEKMRNTWALKRQLGEPIKLKVAI
jgi:group I intron endonuclease